MLTYKQIKDLNYTDLLYEQYLYNLAFYKRKPFKALCYDDSDTSIAIMVFAKTQVGQTVTRTLRVPKDCYREFEERLMRDFELDIELFEDGA